MYILKFLKEKWLLIMGLLAFVLIMFLIVYHPYSGPELIPAPTQLNLTQTETIDYPGRNGPVEIELLAKYEIEAAVKSKKFYTEDYVSQVSPVDLVLAWNDLNKREIDRLIRYSQFNRWYRYEYYSDTFIEKSHIQENSANVHIIPANEKIANIIRKVRENDVIELEGYLAAAHFESGDWISSMTRQDEGDHSCEIMYVLKVSIK